jgi:hypothetical protein
LDLTRFAFCTPIAVNLTTITCSMAAVPSSVGVLQGIAAVMHDETNGTISYFGDPTVIASVVPVIFNQSDLMSANSSILTIYGAGFSPLLANNEIEFELGANLCQIISTTNDQIVCQIPGQVLGGPLSAIVSVKSDNSKWYKSLEYVVVSYIQPLVVANTIAVPLCRCEMPVTITGLGFSPRIVDVAVELVPKGICEIKSTSLDTIECNLPYSPLGALYAFVVVRGVSSPMPVQIASRVIPLGNPADLSPHVLEGEASTGLEPFEST